MKTMWRVQVSRGARFYFSWHATQEAAMRAAADQRARQLWASVRVSLDPVGQIEGRAS